MSLPMITSALLWQHAQQEGLDILHHLRALHVVEARVGLELDVLDTCGSGVGDAGSMKGGDIPGQTHAPAQDSLRPPMRAPSPNKLRTGREQGILGLDADLVRNNGVARAVAGKHWPALERL